MPARSAVSDPTRRQVIARTLMAAGALVSMPILAQAQEQQKMQELPSTGAEALLTYLHQEIDFQVPPQRVYEALLDSRQFAAFTGMPAQINREAGGAFSTFGGLVTGRNIELLPNQRIVQAWRPGSWDPGVYSLVRFEIRQFGPRTLVVLDHTGFPEGTFRHLNSGWYQRYWDPMRKYLA